MPDVERPPTGLGISHVGLSVRDLERSLAFYCDVLGARVLRPPYDSVRGRFRMAVIAWGPISFDLCRHDDGEGERFDPARTVTPSSTRLDGYPALRPTLVSSSVPRAARSAGDRDLIS